MGQLLAAQNLLVRLTDARQVGEFAAHALRALPGAGATAARLDGELAAEGAWETATWESLSRLLESNGSGHRWHRLQGGDVLVIPVASVTDRHGWIAVLAAREPIEQYVPFLANFAQNLALALENLQQRTELAAADSLLHASQAEYEQLFASMTSGLAVHEIVVGADGNPIDYRFLEANRAFEELTGLRREDILGRTALEVLPDLEPEWIEKYARVALLGEQIEFESYAAPLARYYHVVAYSPRPGRFATVFNDITERKRAEEERQRLIEQLQAQSERLQALYEEQQRIATTLQESLIHPLPATDDVDIAVLSRPANSAELIGGDFHDVFTLPDDRIALVIGDVAGKGIRAAGLSETVRSTIRAFAAIDADPGFVLRKTNELLLGDTAEELCVTALFAVLETRSGQLVAASAGHPPPVHLSPDACELMPLEFGPPLGSFASNFTPAHVTMTSADYLVLYTDGITEARCCGELLGELRLVEAVAGLWGRSAEELAREVVATVETFSDGLRDDLEVMVVRPAG